MEFQKISAEPSKPKAAKSHFFQPKLTINQPGDVFEHEADAMADKVMRMTDAPVNQDAFFKPAWSKPANNIAQRKCQACEEEEKHVHRKEITGAEMQGPASLDSYIGSLHASGQPLPDSSRQFFEPRFGRDFSDVRIHNDSAAARSAQSISALAYTSGSNIVFNTGQYSPESDNGKKLLAHELTHVVQQSKNIGTKLIQKLDCSLGHLDTECGNAAASCHTVDAYCGSKYPNAAAITTLYNKTAQGAKDKATSYPQASKNLYHYLDGTGTVLTMPSAVFAAEPATKDKLKNEHRKKFIDGATARLNDGRLTPGGTADMVWTGTANALASMDDMSIAVGGYTLCSKVTVAAAAQGGSSYKITFNTWTVQGFDCYNWDPGKGIGVPGFDDKDLCCLENNGKAKHYRIQTDPWDNKEADCLKEEVVTATPPAPKGASPAPPSAPPAAPPSKWDKFKKWLGF